MSEKVFVFRSVLEAASNAEEVRKEHGAGAIEIHQQPDGSAILTLIPDPEAKEPEK